MRAGIALGSNLGNRLAHLREGRKRLLALHDGSGPFLCSKIYETAPVDCPAGSLPFLNAAIELSTQLPPLDLLVDLQRIEIDSGRQAVHPFHGPRTLDLDFLYLGDVRMSHSSLKLPHPEMLQRFFVIKPLADICPERVVPCAGLSVRELCEKFESRELSAEQSKVVSFF
ncbi:MAG: 2-amino-4-hydroxy-6-hydroxymethyldihydropteridine diphosphokinase [Verrucomicrobiota bacterium]